MLKKTETSKYYKLIRYVNFMLMNIFMTLGKKVKDNNNTGISYQFNPGFGKCLYFQVFNTQLNVTTYLIMSLYI